MYAIYTLIYGIKIPEHLNKRLQMSELSELLEFNLEGIDESEFYCTIPYSGDDFADLHLGVGIASTEDKLNNQESIIQPTECQKELAHKYIPMVLERFLKEVDEFKKEYDITQDDEAIINEFVEELRKQEYKLYFAYSTS